MILNVPSITHLQAMPTDQARRHDAAYLLGKQSVAADFSDRLASLEKGEKTNSLKRSEARHRRREDAEDDIALAIAMTPLHPNPAAGSGAVPEAGDSGSTSPTRFTDALPTAASIPSAAGETAGHSIDRHNAGAAAIPASSGMSAFRDVSAATDLHASMPAERTAPPNDMAAREMRSDPLIHTQEMPPHISMSRDMQALCGEFENSINRFERAGNAWIGSARIVFQSAVLQNTSVQITGDGKSLSIFLRQAVSTGATMSSLLPREEKELCNALSRRLGRAVTLKIEYVSNVQAADDIESQ